jgi:D-alanyl-D-alanine carboxypeptidase/D-alanyl-D-alanine-endopeptidase (penicillin-binding protein 4)
MRVILTILLLSLPFSGQAATDELPSEVIAELRRAKIPLASVGIVVQSSGAEAPLLVKNADRAMNPASTMKLLTTFAALEMLGPAYQWRTEAYLDGVLEDGVLKGDLVMKGYGDPKLTLEQFWLWLREMRQRGLREIQGDLVLDRSFFEEMKHDPAEFDDDPSRAYNVGPSAMLLNFNAVRLRLVPGIEQTDASFEPKLSGYVIQNNITTDSKQPCRGGDTYTARLEERSIVLEGTIPTDCGEIEDYVSLLSHDEYIFAVFSSLWEELGGKVHGTLREGSVPADQVAFSTWQSRPLSEAIRDINKFSNNTMARQLFLTLGAAGGDPASIERSVAVIGEWLTAQQLEFPELVLENGAGLSRKERISPQHLADLLRRAAHSPYSAELEASLPILGMDGTMKKRFKDNGIAGYAHIKTGMLEGVKSIAGYVHAADGKQWVVVFIINHHYAARGQAAQDALIEWVQKGRPEQAGTQLSGALN